jgi:hypothetical protein
VAIREGETRYSFTQSMAGGLFRWVDHGFQSAKSYADGLTKEQLKEHKRQEERKGTERWKMGVNLFSTITSLQQPPNFDKV